MLFSLSKNVFCEREPCDARNNEKIRRAKTIVTNGRKSGVSDASEVENEEKLRGM